MIKLVSAPSDADAVTLISFLASYGIKSYSSQGLKHLTEVWVDNDKDAKQASIHYSEWLELQKSPAPFQSVERRFTLGKFLATILLIGIIMFVIFVTINAFS